MVRLDWFGMLIPLLIVSSLIILLFANMVVMFIYSLINNFTILSSGRIFLLKKKKSGRILTYQLYKNEPKIWDFGQKNLKKEEALGG